VLELLHARLALLEPRRFLRVQRAGFLALLDPALLVGLALVDARGALGLRRRGQRDGSRAEQRGECDDLHSLPPVGW
jgi:hypothetical protein